MRTTAPAPSPPELDRVRTWLEYAASQLPSTKVGGTLSFSVDPQIEATFGKAPAGAFASERGLIGYALRVANGESVQLPESDPRVSADIDRLLDYPSGNPLEHWRGWFRRFLSELLANKGTAQRWVTKQLPDIWALPRVERRGNGFGLRFHILLRSPEALMRFAVLLLADESRDFAPDGPECLCRCKLARCSKFFLKERPEGGLGAPKHVYCSEDHKSEARKADAKERAARSRAARRSK